MNAAAVEVLESARSSRWQIGEWLADPGDDSLRRGESTVKIEPRLMQSLVCLAECAPGIVSLDQLLDRVWRGVVVGPASVYQSISQLRRVLGETDPGTRYIETVARKGYRLVAPVHRVPAPSSADIRGEVSALPSLRSWHWPWLCTVCAALLAGGVMGWQLSQSSF